MGDLQKFDYGQLDEKTASFLRKKESNMRESVGKAYTELGRELYEAQQELAKNGYGCFQQWTESIGIKRNKAYDLIRRYKTIVRISDEQTRELIEDLPASLTYEIAKPSAESTPAKAQAKSEVLAFRQARRLRNSKRTTSSAARLIQRLKHVKERKMAERHGGWSEWLREVGMDRGTAHRFITVYDELGESVGTYQRMGLRALSEIATLPPEEREKEHTLSGGETKTVDEMTVPLTYTFYGFLFFVLSAVYSRPNGFIPARL